MTRNHSSVTKGKQETTCSNGSEDRNRGYKGTSGSDFRSKSEKLSHPLELPRDQLAITLKKCREESMKSIYRLAEDSGVPGGNIWKMERGERQNATRETLLLLSMAMILDYKKIEEIVEVANEILDAAGLKMLRVPWEPQDTHSAQRKLKDSDG